MDGKDHVTCFVGKYHFVLGGGIIKKLEAFSIVNSVGLACSDARALMGVNMVPSTALAKNRNTPVTSWMNFFPAFSSTGASLGGFVYCSFAFCPISS